MVCARVGNICVSSLFLMLLPTHIQRSSRDTNDTLKHYPMHSKPRTSRSTSNPSFRWRVKRSISQSRRNSCKVSRNITAHINNKKDIIAPAKIPSFVLTTTNLALGDRVDPREHEVHDDHHDADDPEHARVVGVVVSEDDGKDDTAKVSCCAHDTRQDTFDELASASSSYWS
jgi:hypothetical protein